MRTVRRGFQDFEFEDDDPDFDCFEQLIELENKRILTRLDFNVISCMFGLHRKLRSLPEVLFESGFTLPENKTSPAGGRIDAIWKYEEENKETRTLKYEQRMWDTMWMRSDHYHIDIEYQVGDLVAIYQFRMCETNYGRSEKHFKHCSLKKNDKIILEHKMDFSR